MASDELALRSFLEAAFAEGQRFRDRWPQPMASVHFSKDGHALEVNLDNTKSYYGDWIKGEGGDISLYREHGTEKVCGAHLPCYAKTLVVGGHFGTIVINLESGKVEVEPPNT